MDALRAKNTIHLKSSGRRGPDMMHVAAKIVAHETTWHCTTWMIRIVNLADMHY
jgi:hypothetical protein